MTKPLIPHWKFLFWALIIIVSLPLLRILASWFEPDSDIWLHLYQTRLSGLVTNTLLLLLGVGIGVTLLGVALAWLVSLCEFPGRKLLEWLLFLPFALPAYVIGFIYLGVFDFPGPVQSWLRDQFSWSGLDIRAYGLTLVLVMTLVLYPYVYMLARSAFYAQNSALIESARLMGMNGWQVFWKVSLPMARPAIAAGLMLALMETLADFGTVSLYNYNTLTTGIFSVWEDFRSLQVSAQLSTLLLGIAVILIFIERISRGKARYDTNHKMSYRPYKLTGILGWSVTLSISSVVFLAFILPVTQLIIWAISAFEIEWNPRYFNWLTNTFILAIVAAFLTVSLAMLLNTVRRHNKLSLISQLGLRFANLGYALPGSVLAIGIMLLIIEAGEAFAPGYGVWLSSGVIALLLAYTVRFLAVAYGPIESYFDTITPSMIDSARSLGANQIQLVNRIYIPILKPGLIVASFMVAVDVMKELPATYLLRPYGWDTLAIRVYELSHDALYEQAAIPALILLLLGLLTLIGVAIINRIYRPKQAKDPEPFS